MKKGDETKEEYDFSKGVRGKYAARFRDGTNLVLLDPNVAKAFPAGKSVNEALRRLMRPPTGSSLPR